MIRGNLHLVLHLLVPACLAWGWFRESPRQAFLWMMATMAVDLDHLLAVPIYDPNRCSIGLHPLHRGPMIAFYVALTLVSGWKLRPREFAQAHPEFFPGRSRLFILHWIGLGLTLHMALDGIDCLMMGAGW